MPTILDLTAEIVLAHASSTQMTPDELLREIQNVHALLQRIEGGSPTVSEVKPTLSIKQAFKKNEVICMVCGKGGMKTLTRHIKQAHDMKPGQYRKQFGIPRTQSLTAKSFSEARKKMAEERGLGDVLVKARKVRAAKLKGRVDPAKKATTAITTKVNRTEANKTKAVLKKVK